MSHTPEQESLSAQWRFKSYTASNTRPSTAPRKKHKHLVMITQVRFKAKYRDMSGLPRDKHLHTVCCKDVQGVRAIVSKPLIKIGTCGEKNRLKDFIMYHFVSLIRKH